MIYDAEEDPLCYEGTTVLRNRIGLRVQDELDEFELAVFITRFEEPWPEGALDLEHYKSLHHHLFQDVYEWAGQLRTIRIGKGGNWFCYPEYIQPHLEKMFARLKQLNHLKGLNRQAFSRKAAHILAEINAVHPFREGNGRTQLVFLMLLVEQAGFSFDADVLTRNRVLRAMIDSFSGAEEPLAALILDIISDHPKPGA